MKDDKTLRNVLREKISIINNKLPKTARKEIDKLMFENYNVQAAKVSDVFNGFEPIEAIPFHMLYKLTVVIKELSIQRGDFDGSDLNINDYFYENEIVEYSKPIPKVDEDIDVEFDDWHKTDIGAYSYFDIHTNIDYVMKLYNYNKLRFNPDVQRDLIVIETEGMPIYKLDINEKSIENMTKSMLDGTYFPVPGTIVVNPELYSEYPVKFRDGKIFIDRKFKIDLAEGFHNYLSYIGAKIEKPDWQYPCDFRLYVINVEDANRFILQMDKKNHFTESQTTRIDDANPSNYFVKSLNNSGSFNLRGTINDEIRMYLSKLVSDLFNFKEIPDAAQMLKQVVTRLNYIIMETNHFKNNLSKEEWFIYLYLIKQSIDKGLDFENLFNSIDIDNLINEVQFKNDPSRKHFILLNEIIKGVTSNV